MEAQIDPFTGGLIFEYAENVQKLREDKKQDNTVVQQSKSPVSDFGYKFDPVPSRLPIEKRIELVQLVGEEIIEQKELHSLFQRKKFPICYDGFEPSGRMHIAQGILRAINVNRLVDAGCIFIFWVADWFAMLNNKYEGDLEKIRVVGKYFIEIWKAVGMKMHNVKILWASDEINNRANEYWLTVMDIARRNNIKRINRCCTIMGRSEDAELSVGQYFYPCMQCTDILFLNADICSLGIDQRQVNMLNREYCDDIKLKHKPVIVSHHMINGLKEGQEKMSKSDPDSAIFMEDSESDVQRKIDKAYCPEGIVEKNPILDYTKNLIFGARTELQIERKEEYGGNVLYKDYKTLENDFAEKQLHPGDLQKAVIKVINEFIKPVRDHFTNNPEAKQLLEQIKKFNQTK